MAPLGPTAWQSGYDTQSVTAEQRRAMRALAAQPEQMGQIMRVGLLGVAFLPMAAAVIGLVASPGDVMAKLPAVGASTTISLLAVLPFVVIARRRRPLSEQMARVAKQLGGTSTIDRLAVVVDWMDRHWPWSVTLSVLLYGSLGARRWCAVGTYEGLDVLVSAQRMMSTKWGPAVQRIDVFVTAGGRGIRAAPARALGYDVEHTERGVHYFRRDTAPAALGPEELRTLLDAARAAFA